MLHFAVERRTYRSTGELSPQELRSVVNVIRQAGLAFVAPRTVAIDIQIGPVHQSTPLRTVTLF